MIRLHTRKMGDDWPYDQAPFAKDAGALHALYDKARAVLMGGSATARRVFEFVESSSIVIDMIVSRGKSGGYFLPADPSYGFDFHGSSGLIVWYPEASFEFYVEGPQPTHINPETGSKWCLMAASSDLVLAHELGHVVQYMTDFGSNAARFHAEYKANLLLIENDNVRRHERPVAQEMGNFMTRKDYRTSKDSEWSGKLIRI
ncbi:hypothetical protein JD974_04970 [Chromobacterium haemolyticum]|uniref:Lysine-specific metallo-endopeptidase domain-containing protein n=1 Tax=Chromobacterium haemolyticum TaxID=394935 RepID=A0ABS3GJF0_9NEIS|nr:hypothetical protein [Chromobacterium haemolyticum]MBK0413751.1 hypothetical protein [Chromobacterium haemolyticum]MBO0414853.1 hypothetical protein [Chromobacterium haemolyticum]MBO0498114.1 hypothetical protein [Chromobacterium haemolyticum]QOD81164.1 hypothetical protein IEZ30_14605 [Chromobacterium haemolyticum]